MVQLSEPPLNTLQTLYIPDFFLFATVPLADPMKTAVGLEKENYSYTKQIFNLLFKILEDNNITQVWQYMY